MKASYALRAVVVGAMCLVVLVGMLVRHAWPLWTGNTIYLKVRPVDPRDLFRGDYVILAYDIGELPTPDPAPLPGTRQYVQLRGVPTTVTGVPTQYVAASISSEPAEGAVNLAGRVRNYFSGVESLDFGIDALFVQEGSGRPIEEAIRRGAPVFAEVAVTADGSARVRALVIDGQRVP